MVHAVQGKLNPADERVARLLTWTPWFSMFTISLPLPLIFLAFYFSAVTTESAAIFLAVSFVSLGLGLVAGLLVLIVLLAYRNRWHRRLRDRLAADGITADEVRWFTSELKSEERTTWDELRKTKPSLADAYGETLAVRLTATRVIKRVRTGTLRIERQINRLRNIPNADTDSLLKDLLSDRERLEDLLEEAKVRLSQAEARLQMIEVAANRSLDENETDLMLQRLAFSQQQMPIALELANLEREALSAADSEQETLTKT